MFIKVNDRNLYFIPIKQHGYYTFLVKMSELRERNNLPSESFTESDGPLVVRSFIASDEQDVRDLVFTHVRSQVISSVQFWIFRNFTHVLLPILFFTFFFVTLFELFIIISLTIICLFVRSKYELEMYIKYSCKDLVDIYANYIADKSRHFWVAEFDPNYGLKKSSSAPLPKKIIGCIGLVPVREDPQRICQVYRLVVDPNQRRLKVGTHLLNALEDYTRKNNPSCSEVRMIANNLNPSTHYFYLRNGYHVLQYIQRNLMRGDLIAYRKKMNSKSESPLPESNHSGDVTMAELQEGQL